MNYILFSKIKGFLSSTLDGGTWDKNPEKAYLRKTDYETDTVITSITNKENAKWIREDEVRKLSYGEALYQLCTIIGNTTNTKAASDALLRITGESWCKNEDELWQNNNTKLNKNELSAHIIKNAPSKDDIAEILDNISLVDYWTNDTRYIYSTPPKEVVIYKATALKLLDQLSSLTDKFVSTSQSKNNNFNGDELIAKVQKLSAEINCIQQHQLNRY